MSTAKFAQLKSIFAHALELREGEVAPYLDAVCAGNTRLRAQVEEMLRQAISADTALISDAPAAIGPALQLGTRLSERFTLKRFIGRGGMGEVYLAEDEELGGEVALKTVRGGLLDDKGALRFRREVQLSRQVTHPNICRVFDVGKETIDGRELLFLTMEYMEGETLAQRLSRAGKFAPEEAEPLVRQMAAALDALHQKGIMHRDLKPGNVMLDKSRLCIMDFGLARAFQGDGSDDHYTQTGAILGTPGYMAPEQLMGEQATAASDIYTMGLLIFEMLTGKKASLVDTLAAGKTGLEPKWERLILACVTRDPSTRPKSGAEAMALLEQPDASDPRAGWKRGWIAAAVVVVAALGGAQFFLPEKLNEVKTGGSASVNDEILHARKLLERYYKPQNVKEAISILEGVVAKNPNLALGHAALGAALFRVTSDRSDRSKIEQARQASNRAIELDPEIAEPHVTLGTIYLEAGRRDLARSELKKAFDLDSKLPEVHFALAQLYRAEGRIAEAQESIQKAIDLAPENWSYHNWRSMEYRDKGQYPEARAELETAAKLMPDNPLIYNNLGVVFLRMNQFSDAQRAFEKSNELEPRARTLGNLGTVYYQLGDYEKAAEALKKAADMDPKSYLARANLGAALDRLPARKAEAMDAYRQALELAAPVVATAPNDHRMIANLASYHAVLGNREKALQMIRRAIALRPDSPDVANRAVAVYEFLKDREQALQWAAKAVENGYPFETLKNDPELAGLRTDPRFSKLEGLKKEKRP